MSPSQSSFSGRGTSGSRRVDATFDAIWSHAIPYTMPDTRTLAAPIRSPTLSQEVSAPERRNHRANRSTNKKVGKSPHEQYVIISATWLARRVDETAAGRHRMMY
jgi:hypothetical protein